MARLIGIAVVVTTVLAGACAEVRNGQMPTAQERNAAGDMVAQLVAMSEQPTRASDLARAGSTVPLSSLIMPPDFPLPSPAPVSSDSAVTYSVITDVTDSVTTDSVTTDSVTADSVLAASPDAISTATDMTADAASHTTASTPFDADSLDDCLVASDTSLTYAECQVAHHVFDGTWSSQGQRIHAELVDVFATAQGELGTVAIDASLDRRADLSTLAGLVLHGSFDIGIMWTVDRRDYVVDVRVRIDNLTVEGDCATGGSITMSGELDDSPLSPTTLWFGPSCGDVQISR